MSGREPRILVFTTLFPHAGQPGAGLFIRERMFRVSASLPLMVVVPVPWFPLQWLIRRFKPSFRPTAPRFERQDGIEVHFPRFLSVPGAFKWLDGLLMAVCCMPVMLKLKRRFDFNVIDAHFAYPDGYAATLLGRWLGLPTTITLRGTEVPVSNDPARKQRMLKALAWASRVFSVSMSLKQHVVRLGADACKIQVVGNGVDIVKFRPISRLQARRELSWPAEVPVLISVGALVERKGFHRVMECLPHLRREFPGLLYVIVGGAGPEGDWRDALRARARELAVENCVLFTGPLAPEYLHVPLSAADVFVLATRNEGWANVFLEAMACGLPVITTDVGGNAEVVTRPEVGAVVPFDDQAALYRAIAAALRKPWDRDCIVAHAHANAWDGRVATLLTAFRDIVAESIEQDSSARLVRDSRP